MYSKIKTFPLYVLAGFSGIMGVKAANTGQWGSTITFPLVPVAAAVIPGSGNLLVWSAYSDNTFQIGKSNMTQTAIYNPATGSVTAVTVTNTGHDMFCPGISMDFNGRVTVTGGDTAARTSIYNPAGNNWISGGNMNIPRGYQASTTLSDGRIFTIGGSWSGALGGKNGEIFSPSSNTWSLLSGALVAPMLTADSQGIFRQDNHAWLFSWKNSYVFQGGPSKTMHWYGMAGSGSVVSAGLRGDDSDAMTGNAIMYDAVAGKILAVGGSPNYQDSSATSNAHIITIGNPTASASVTKINPMYFRRAFANSVPTPDGNVLIFGGQSYAVPFSDGNSTLTPELWNASSTHFTKMTVGPTPRNYHSVALLMPDASVFSAGGGLCASCTTNHFDGEFFFPPYLYQSDGVTKATRPVISSISSSTIGIGAKITAVMNSPVKSFAMIRMSAATHSVNTDQRRVPLVPSVSGSSYSMTLPSDAGIMLPGYWMLFAVTAAGVPSVAKTILVTL